MAAPFVGSQVWLKLVEHPASTVTLPVIRQLTQSDVQDLLAVFAEGAREEQQVAFGILRTLSRQSTKLPEVPWTDTSRSHFIRHLGDKSRLDYSSGVVSRVHGNWAVRMLWAELDPQACVQFLSSLPLESSTGVQAEALETLAGKARSVSEARTWLEERVVAGGAVGLLVREVLEDVGFVSEERLEHWGRRWRDEKDPVALSWLYDRWLSYLPVGHPMDHLLSVLGRPDDGQPPDIYYKSSGGHVYIEVHKSTGFSGCHRT